jgi:hypothetical protein
MAFGKLLGDILGKILTISPEIPKDVEILKEQRQLIRDFVSMKAPRLLVDKRRPLWKGPIPDRYYYVVRNKKHPKMSAWVVPFTDDPRFERHIRQISCNQGGEWSLIESDVPLPEGSACVKRAHSKVDEIVDKLRMSNAYDTKILDGKGERIRSEGTPVREEEVFG